MPKEAYPTKFCSACGQKMHAEAKACPNCGLPCEANEQEVEGEDSSIVAKDHGDYGTITILSILLPLIGLIAGIIYLAKNQPVDKKLGEHAISVSILFIIIWSLVFTVINV